MKFTDIEIIAMPLILALVLVVMISSTIHLKDSLSELSLMLVEKYEDDSKTIYFYNTTRTDLENILSNLNNSNWMDISEDQANLIIKE